MSGPPPDTGIAPPASPGLAAPAAASLAVCGVGPWLPALPLAAMSGFVALPPAWRWGLAAILAAYAAVTEMAKSWLIRRFGIG